MPGLASRTIVSSWLLRRLYVRRIISPRVSPAWTTITRGVGNGTWGGTVSLGAAVGLIGSVPCSRICFTGAGMSSALRDPRRRVVWRSVPNSVRFSVRGAMGTVAVCMDGVAWDGPGGSPGRWLIRGVSANGRVVCCGEDGSAANSRCTNWTIPCGRRSGCGTNPPQVTRLRIMPAAIPPSKDHQKPRRFARLCARVVAAVACLLASLSGVFT